MKKLVCLVFILCYLLPAEAQRDRFFTPYQGLSNTSFNSIAQDNDGALWFATYGGLNKFDGYNFAVYQHNPADPNSLDLNAVYSVFVDSKGKLWVGTERRLFTYNKKLDNFTPYHIRLQNKEILPQVNAILEDNKNNLWLITSYGLILIDGKTNNQFFFNQQFADSVTLTRDLLNTALFDDNGCLWIGTDKDGLLCYNTKRNEFTSYRHNNTGNSICDNSILSIGKDHKGNIIIGTAKGGISIFNPVTKTFKSIPYSHSRDNILNGGVYSIVTDKKGTIWVGTERNGLKTLDLATYTLHDANALIDLENISDAKIHCFNDRQGNLWLGVDYAGVYLKKESATPFFNFRKRPNSPVSISHNIVKSLLYDNENNLWVGTDGGGLNCLPANDRHVRYFVHNPDNKSTIPDNAVISLFEDKQNNLWVGTYLGGLSLFDRKRGNFTTFLIDSLNKGRDLNFVSSIVADSLDNLWVSTNGSGLQYFNIKTRRFKSYPKIETGKTSVNIPLYQTNLLVDREHTLWIATYNGLFAWNKEKSLFSTFSVANGKLDNDAIYTLLEDKKSNIWFGTACGLYCFNKKNRELKKYTTSNGLPNNSVFGILEDNKENIWISTLNGLSKFDPKLNIFRNYYTYDGLAGNEFRPSSCCKAKNGTLYFGSTSGVVYFNPDSVMESTWYPSLVFTNFKVFNTAVPIGKMADGRTILHQSVNESENITLRYADDNFTIEFAAIDFSAPEKIKYAFMLDGFDKKWIYKDYNQRYATYTNVNPGSYVFRLKSTNIDGGWSNKYKTVTIIIKPPLWKTRWALIFYFGILISTFVIIRKLMIFRMTMQNKLAIERLEREKLEELNQSKLQFFSNVSHEFRTPLTLILGPIERLSNANLEGVLKKQIEFIHKNALRLLRLVNLLLDLQKVEKNEMNLRARLGDIVAFTKEIAMSFEELAQHKKISITFTSEIKKLDIWYDSDKLDKVLFNILSNALKFTPKGGSITIELSTGAGENYATPLHKFVNIAVTDTGKGMKTEHQYKIFERFYQIEGSESEMQLGTGIGLHLSKFLMELHQGKILVSSKEGEGTRFDLLIPLESSYLREDQKVIEIDNISANPIDVVSIEPLTPGAAKVNGKNGVKVKKQSRRYKILIVEDDHEIRNYIKSELQEQYDILEAFDGTEGCEVAQNKMPDLIISDVMMPGMNGIQLCRKIKTDITTSHIPVILLTARTSIENRIEGLEMGADSYIPKPFNPKHLLVRVEKLIELRENLLNKFSKSINFEAKEMTLTSADERFLQKAINLVKDNISNSDLNIEDMGTDLGMSRVHLYRKLKALTNQTPSEFVRTIRLKQAAYLLLQNKINISEVAYAVGFSSHQYFTNCFQNYFNMSPTEYSHKGRESDKAVNIGE